MAQEVFQPLVETHTSSPPPIQVLAFCWSWTSGMTNRGAGSQFAFGVWPTVAWPRR